VNEPPDPIREEVPAQSGPWHRRSRRTVYENPWLSVWHDEVTRPDGDPGIYGVIHFHGAAVAVVVVGEDGRLLLVGQHRYTLDAYSWEVPEGGVGPDESLLDGARRELREETGYEADDWRLLCTVSVSNSVTDERGAIFVASGLRPGVAAPDGTEDLQLRWETLDAVLVMIDSGEIHDILTIAGVSRYALEVCRGR
jgi:8-oxo-dGTP pyrophosphatase MutT (NUDIX family)